VKKISCGTEDILKFLKIGKVKNIILHFGAVDFETEVP
jgi:hypothetical protein